MHAFNGHVHPAIPHLFDQVEHEPYDPHICVHSRHRLRNYQESGDDKGKHHHHGEPRPEHQHPSDRDEQRLVHIHPHHMHNYVMDGGVLCFHCYVFFRAALAKKGKVK